ncbi:ferrous iron transport protein B [Luteibacter pinisoli]|uniref:Ferrous iron transport protein B n=1 Tax=Luteibacter pinisoli TaxID=2589080 RepID=A0A4Y5Z2S2_9GAMM|nr:ferrous iron transport protein B [Luteibacter pinisoli]QDE39334.1 ferrous iron transport protein B [Luteibacter pinisoli]
MSPSTMRIALVGNPNCGKTALFNQLTGGRQKVANYAGVTVERKEGRFTAPSGRVLHILDLPGAYSFDATSPDEAITRDVCQGRYPGEAAPDLIVCVADATNLRLHLRFVLEVRRLGRPVVLALNMMDAARRRGMVIDTQKLSQRLGVPVVETVAVQRGGARLLIERIDQAVPAIVPSAIDDASVEQLHAEVRSILAETVSLSRDTAAVDDAIDRWALHPVFGLAILAALMFMIFQAVFSWAQPVMDAIQAGIAALGTWTTSFLPPDSALHSLLNDGVFAGLGAVLVFLPQILILFLFILVLEESGYLPRAAFLLDRMMFRVGLTGRAFIPLLSSFACAIPGIMATRSISDPRDRLTTIMVAPLMTCSARLPVYTLLIAAFIPNHSVGIFNLQGIVLFVLYFAGIFSALGVAFVMKRFRKDRSEHALIMELPSYRLPHVRDIALGLWERALIFLKRVGGIITALTVLLWFLSSFPGAPEGATQPAIDYSLAGMLGRGLQYVFAPIGFNWQICIALVPGLAAREVAVAALGTVYAMSGSDDAVASQLGPVIAHSWSLATALSLLAWYVFAPQCMSTLAVIRRETNSWRNVAVAAGYLFGLAYLASLATYQIARALS